MMYSLRHCDNVFRISLYNALHTSPFFWLSIHYICLTKSWTYKGMWLPLGFQFDFKYIELRTHHLLLLCYHAACWIRLEPISPIAYSLGKSVCVLFSPLHKHQHFKSLMSFNRYINHVKSAVSFHYEFPSDTSVFMDGFVGLCARCVCPCSNVATRTSLVFILIIKVLQFYRQSSSPVLASADCVGTCLSVSWDCSLFYATCFWLRFCFAFAFYRYYILCT